MFTFYLKGKMSFFPIRCFTCGKVISQHYNTYQREVDENKDPREVLDKLKIVKVCCRRMFLTHVDLEHIQSQYPIVEENIQRLGIDQRR